MTNDEFNAAEDIELAKLPEEFRSTVSHECYERGHAYGRSEVLSYVRQMVSMLVPLIEAYTARIKEKA